MPYRYFDIMKQVVPDGEIEPRFFKEIQFRIFGSYDALYVGKEAASIAEMKRVHEERHAVDWQFDRQPMFVFYPNNMSDSIEEILSINDKKGYPLTLTLVQLDKNVLKKSSALLEDILRKYQQVLDKAMLNTNSKALASWNLSGSDLLIFSRVDRLSDVATVIDILYDVSGKDPCLFPVFSTSSHCAIVGGSADEMTAYSKEWLQRDNSAKLQVYFETACGYDQIRLEDTEMILGERDYRLSDRNEMARLANLEYVLQHQVMEPNGKFAFRSSYIIPIIPVEKKERVLGSDHKHDLNTEKDMVSEKLERLIDTLNNDSKYHGVISTEEIKHAKSTLQGLLKYAYRLEASIHQYDLFNRILKLYEKISEILDLYQVKAEEHTLTSNHIYELQKGLMLFVTDLQHLITVLALSPHTYMETYSSSMRSLNAAAKLWDAYNGVIITMRQIFQTKNQGKTQTCEVLLSPYRGRASMNQLLFSTVSENNTIIILYMNFRMMFNKKQALFMLTHEMGHHLGLQIREQRFHSMTKAIAAAMMKFATPAIQNPLWQACKPVLMSEEIDLSYYDKSIRAFFDINMLNDKEVSDLLLIPPANILTKAEKIKLYHDLSGKIKNQIYAVFDHELEMIDQEFSTIYLSRPQKSWKSAAFFSEELVVEYKKNLAAIVERHGLIIWENVKKILLEVLEKECDALDPYQVAQLRGEWKYWKTKANLDKRVFQGIERQIENKIVSIYREVHADLVSIKSLGIQSDVREYFDFVKNTVDVYPPVLAVQTNIIRLFLIYHVVYRKRETGRDDIHVSAVEMVQWINSLREYTSKTKSIACKSIFEFAISVQIIPMIEFTIESAKQIDEELNTLADRTGLQHIRDWYLQELDAEHIHYFWKQSLN